MKVVNRVAPTDRLPFIKAMAHIATADDSVDVNEKEMVEEYAEAWSLDDQQKQQVRSILNADQNLSINRLTNKFSESGTRFLLMKELMRISYADGTYGDAERKEIAAIAQRMGMSEQQFREVEKWAGRGQAWETGTDDGGAETEALEDVISREDDHEDDYDLDDIQTTDSDLSEISPGGYEIDEEDLKEIEEEIEEETENETENEAENETEADEADEGDSEESDDEGDEEDEEENKEEKSASA